MPAWAVQEGGGQPASLVVELLIPATVEDWETGMGKGVNCIHKLQEALYKGPEWLNFCLGWRIIVSKKK